jgi:hypothetical protein
MKKKNIGTPHVIKSPFLWNSTNKSCFLSSVSKYLIHMITKVYIKKMPMLKSEPEQFFWEEEEILYLTLPPPSQTPSRRSPWTWVRGWYHGWRKRKGKYIEEGGPTYAAQSLTQYNSAFATRVLQSTYVCVKVWRERESVPEFSNFSGPQASIPRN